MALTPNTSNPDGSIQALKQYGGNIITVILLALAGYFGWTYWQNNHARVDTVAADQYADIQRLNDELSLAAQNPDLPAEAQTALSADRAMLDKNIDTLVSTHGESVYAWQALMLKARLQVDSDDLKGATDTLKQALAIDMGDAGLTAITRLRYARMLLTSGDTDAALVEAKNDMPSSFEPSQQELLGDIYLAKNDKKLAIQAYNNAWKMLSARQETRAVLALKMESLGVVPEPITEPASIVQASAAEPISIEDALSEDAITVDNSANTIDNNTANAPKPNE